jgi:hypothetical protein
MGCLICRNGREAARQRVERPRAGPPGNNWPHRARTKANHDRGGRSLGLRPVAWSQWCHWKKIEFLAALRVLSLPYLLTVSCKFTHTGA